jgi:hypothetical protein
MVEQSALEERAESGLLAGLTVPLAMPRPTTHTQVMDASGELAAANQAVHNMGERVAPVMPAPPVHKRPG